MTTKKMKATKNFWRMLIFSIVFFLIAIAVLSGFAHKYINFSTTEGEIAVFLGSSILFLLCFCVFIIEVFDIFFDIYVKIFKK